MTTFFKRIKSHICVLLCVILLTSLMLPCFSVSAAGGVSLNDGSDALMAQFKHAKGPESGGFIMGYSYYSPVKGKNDKQKYPLCVFLPGFNEGNSVGDEVKSNDFHRWSSKEYQANFIQGGGYIMLCRPKSNMLTEFNNSVLISAVHAAVKDFANKNPNVDKNRIYILGWSYGGAGCIMQAATYPDFYAAAVPMSPTRTMTESEAAALSNTAVWWLACKNDRFALWGSTSGPGWANLKKAAKDKSRIRLTTYTSAPTTIVLVNHDVWCDAEHDMQGHPDAKGKKSVDGNGNSINLNESMIKWLSKQSLNNSVQNTTCACSCHSKNPIKKIIWSMRVLMWRLFGVKSRQTCACGAKHF